MTDNIEQPIEILVSHAQRTSDRVTNEILLAISECIRGKELHLNGQTLTLKPLGETGVGVRNGELSLLFDVKHVEGFDHIEFKIVKTGWGKSV